MAGQARTGLVVWVLGGLVALVSVAAMAWMWRSGGVRLERSAQSPSVEECGAVLSGSTAMAARLAPVIVTGFLQSSGYAVTTEAPSPSETRVIGSRGNFRCSVSIVMSTTTQGLHDLAEGRTLIAMAQRPMTLRDIEMLRAAGAGDFAAERALAEHVVAFDAYSVVVHDSNPVRAMSLDYVREVGLGARDNWRQVGGPDAPIVTYAPIDGVGPEDYPNDLIQRANPVWQSARERGRVYPHEAAVVEALAQDPAGVGFFSAAFLRDAPNLRALEVATVGPAAAPTAANVRAELYPLARRLFVYVRPADMRSNSFAQRFVSYFRSPAAFDLIDEAGFVALRPESRMSAVASTLSGCRFGTAEYAALMSATQGAQRLPVELRFEGMRLDPAARDYVAQNAASLRDRMRAGSSVILIGHTDISGDLSDNRALALRRAIAVRTAFEAHGLFGLVVESAGEQCPTGDNDTPEGRERNRRVEIWLRSAADAAPAAASP